MITAPESAATSTQDNQGETDGKKQNRSRSPAKLPTAEACHGLFGQVRQAVQLPAPLREQGSVADGHMHPPCTEANNTMTQAGTHQCMTHLSWGQQMIETRLQVLSCSRHATMNAAAYLSACLAHLGLSTVCTAAASPLTQWPAEQSTGLQGCA